MRRVLERRAIDEPFCSGRTAPLLLKLENLIQIPVFISVQVKTIEMREACNKSKNGQKRGPNSHKVSTKEKYGTRGIP